VLATSALMVSEIPYPQPDRRTIPLLCGYWLAVAAALAGLLPLWPVVVVWLTAVPLVPVAWAARANPHFLASVSARRPPSRVSQRQRVV
jgi:hypothetical protein